MTEKKPSEPGPGEMCLCGGSYHKKMSGCDMPIVKVPSNWGSEGTGEKACSCWEKRPGSIIEVVRIETMLCARCGQKWGDTPQEAYRKYLERHEDKDKRISELEQHTANLTGALNLEKSQHEKADVEFSKENGELVTKCHQLERRNEELERDLAGTQKIYRDETTKAYERITDLERQLSEANRLLDLASGSYREQRQLENSLSSSIADLKQELFSKTKELSEAKKVKHIFSPADTELWIKELKQNLSERDKVVEKLQEELMEMVAQHCHTDRPGYDLESFCLSANASALRLLGELGLILLDDRGMRVVLGKWKPVQSAADLKRGSWLKPKGEGHGK